MSDDEEKHTTATQTDTDLSSNARYGFPRPAPATSTVWWQLCASFHCCNSFDMSLPASMTKLCSTSPRRTGRRASRYRIFLLAIGGTTTAFDPPRSCSKWGVAPKPSIHHVTSFRYASQCAWQFSTLLGWCLRTCFFSLFFVHFHVRPHASTSTEAYSSLAMLTPFLTQKQPRFFETNCWATLLSSLSKKLEASTYPSASLTIHKHLWFRPPHLVLSHVHATAEPWFSAQETPWKTFPAALFHHLSKTRHH